MPSFRSRNAADLNSLITLLKDDEYEDANRATPACPVTLNSQLSPAHAVLRRSTPTRSDRVFDGESVRSERRSLATTAQTWNIPSEQCSRTMLHFDLNDEDGP